MIPGEVFAADPGVRLMRSEYREPRCGTFPFPVSLESIGDDMKVPLRRFMRGERLPQHQVDRLLRRAMHMKPVWIARIIGIKPDGRPVRRFLKPHKDYSLANSVGSRGVYYTYLLQDGPIYEIQEDLSFRRNQRSFVRFYGGKRSEMSLDEVMACLES